MHLMNTRPASAPTILKFPKKERQLEELLDLKTKTDQLLVNGGSRVCVQRQHHIFGPLNDINAHMSHYAVVEIYGKFGDLYC